MEWWSPAPLMYWTQMAGTMTPALQRYKDGNPFFQSSQLRATTSHSLHGPVDLSLRFWINRFRVIELIDSTIEQLIQHDSTIIQLYQLNPYDINNWFNNWFNRLFQILCPSHRRQMSLTSSQRFKAISWRISKNSLLPIENNVKHDMAENWDWDATRLVFWLSLLILMLKPFLLLKTALMHTSASWKHGPATLRCLLVCQDVERYCTVWFTWSSCQDLKKGELPPLEAAWGPVMISFKWSATPAAPDVPWDRSKTS